MALLWCNDNIISSGLPEINSTFGNKYSLEGK